MNEMKMKLVPMNILPASAIVILRSIQGRSWAAATVASLASTRWAGAVVNDTRRGFELLMHESEVQAIKAVNS